ncbi:GPO family capsid scaffolding protein [Actinobacillus equuli]|uniref:GPO family capsid scaffolding protein n=1 Tax=Actinobacillus equuli TaxID=718 RepID=UPI0024416B84|nr:GPO family capsid scaffolding protein [Actinobacillus equuli]WGE76095.1 GPO family capsid scaffolding protein [Actinobacillus equuli subsp. haemolyticus]WGE78034.1 GPO family capsid scaffolding protein [Actinobacillus equuli subsp. haemolyticus]
MGKNKFKKREPKWFALATEGKTADGREIKREWIEEMAETYDPKNCTPTRINLEHIKFRRFDKTDPHSLSYGDVLEVKAEEREDGKLQLFGLLDPTDDLIELNNKRQKIYTSIEFTTNYAETGKAYLLGLAVTDSPTSLGTEMLQFSRVENGETIEEMQIVHSEFAEQEMSFDEVKTSFLDSIKAKFTKAEKVQETAFANTEQRFSEQEEAIGLLANECESLKKELSQRNEKISELSETVAEIAQKFAELETQEAKNYTKLPAQTGENKSTNLANF